MMCVLFWGFMGQTAYVLNWKLGWLNENGLLISPLPRLDELCAQTDKRAGDGSAPDVSSHAGAHQVRQPPDKWSSMACAVSKVSAQRAEQK